LLKCHEFKRFLIFIIDIKVTKFVRFINKIYLDIIIYTLEIDGSKYGLSKTQANLPPSPREYQHLSDIP
jgi:hypothetical protein